MSIGGTAISAIYNLNPYTSPFGLYTKIVNKLDGVEEEKQDNEVMARGRKFEEALIAFHEVEADLEKGIYQHTAKHDKYDFLHGSVDAFYPKHDKLVEIKTADWSQLSKYDFENQQVPDHYYMQGAWYAGLCNVSTWDLTVAFFIDNKMVKHETITFDLDEEFFDKMVKRAVEFWNEHIIPRKPPAITDPYERIVEYRRVWRDHNESMVQGMGKHDDLVKKHFELTAQIAELEKEDTAVKADLIEAIGDNLGIVTSLGKVTFKRNKNSLKTNWEDIAVELGADDYIIQRHTKEVEGSRVLRFPTVKKG